MSLQRIIESARKLGVPVIMTDPAGREPLVIVSLEQFEAMAGTSQEVLQDKPAEAARYSNFDADTAFPEPNLVTQSIEPQDMPQDVYLEDMPPAQAPKPMTDEERFYLEPLDDQNG